MENRYSYTCRNTQAVKTCDNSTQTCDTKCDEVRGGLQLCQNPAECDPKSKSFNQNIADTILKMGGSVWNKLLLGDNDVGDGYWRPNVLVTSLRCW